MRKATLLCVGAAHAFFTAHPLVAEEMTFYGIDWDNCTELIDQFIDKYAQGNIDRVQLLSSSEATTAAIIGDTELVTVTCTRDKTQNIFEMRSSPL